MSNIKNNPELYFRALNAFTESFKELEEEALSAGISPLDLARKYAHFEKSMTRLLNNEQAKKFMINDSDILTIQHQFNAKRVTLDEIKLQFEDRIKMLLDHLDWYGRVIVSIEQP